VRNVGSILLGAVALAVLDGVVSRPAATKNVGGFIAGAGKAVNWFLSPTVPAFKVVAKAPNPLAPGGSGAFEAPGPITDVPPAGGLPNLATTPVPPALSSTGTTTLV
jgi:hypothetical protein